MKDKRHGAAVAYEPTQDKIYVMGGGDAFLTSCEYYDVINDEWMQFAKLNERKKYTTPSILDNKFIYLFGGIDN